MKITLVHLEVPEVYLKNQKKIKQENHRVPDGLVDNSMILMY